MTTSQVDQVSKDMNINLVDYLSISVLLHRTQQMPPL